MLKGFKEFIMRGNVIDLAVAFVIGVAFANVVNSIVDGIITPIIAAVFGEPSLAKVGNFTINDAEFSIGAVLDALFTFLATAAAIYFLIVFPLNKLAERRKRGEVAVAVAVEQESSPTEIELLTEIRDSLKK